MVRETMRTGSLEYRPGGALRPEHELKGLQDEEYACFRKLRYGTSKLGPEERVVAKGVVCYLPPSWKVGTP